MTTTWWDAALAESEWAGPGHHDVRGMTIRQRDRISPSGDSSLHENRVVGCLDGETPVSPTRDAVGEYWSRGVHWRAGSALLQGIDAERATTVGDDLDIRGQLSQALGLDRQVEELQPTADRLADQGELLGERPFHCRRRSHLADSTARAGTTWWMVVVASTSSTIT